MSSQKRVKKGDFLKKLYDRLSKHSQVIIVSLMNVGSNQVQNIRKGLCAKKSELVIGKNTLIRKAIKMRSNELSEDVEDHAYFSQYGKPLEQLSALQEQIKGKVGLIFTDEPVFELKPIIESHKVKTPAKVGMIAPINVTVPPGPSGLDPSQISFFHALHISTKIQKGQIEILKEVKVCEKGKVVGNSEATLLKKLNINPFLYGMELISVYDDGSILAPEVMTMTPDDICEKFKSGVNNLISLSLNLGFANELSIPHMVINSFKNLAAISLSTKYKLAALENLSSAQPAAQKVEKAEAKKEEPKNAEPEKEEEEEVDMGGLFGDF